ncbi:NAD(P)-dependent dehydrogenase (short-subunit alcohol dehydrogenase family) [Streptosporangium becharense]|uniref:NAD(P)-dependent dehydrogenase (Short-subunit alcohol dehydrogenase family) n=1 Tax=Streptosporangium becharense TaxID=1816182 RepID=A0A7W9IEG1_9ACTN|nr:SDR family oxidoreductase [Streptosporangium becharense]MBB2909818.1 NAD(P)-dependent dehydrogenase (short-subunit alcohol dehydrogenase family) [Streptosporangium becharense]MBB5819227.1 NAD(P)-dependent dehydrogenase (short-subunit alcohol dehydrogenase family) [Streptosporangium becharense]
MGRLDDNVVIVTGGANGIGRWYCTALALEGARVVVCDIDGPGAADFAGWLNDRAGAERAYPLCVDVTSPERTADMAATVMARFGAIDVLVNNAGSYPHVAFEDIDHDAWRRVITLNLDSVFLCCRAVLPVMVKQGRGAIVNVATNLVWSGLANMAHYIAAKSGVIGLTKALAREYGEHGVRVNALAPGAVVPDLPDRRLSPAGREAVEEILQYQSVKRHQHPRDLVGTMLFLCSAESEFMSGQVLTVDGGLTMH